MLKRGKKITSLLVVAASVMSLLPAMAADSSSRLGTKDGTIEKAIVYKDGKYVYQGYKSDDDNGAIYYNEGDKDKELDDVSDADLNVTYGDKYAFANDSGDQYLIDLTSGAVVDDTTPSDGIDTAATKLKTKLKKTDRYGDGISVEAKDLDLDYDEASNISDNLTGAIPGNKFGNIWYPYRVDATSGKADSNLVDGQDGQYLYGFTDNSGNYIDASNLANIYAYSSEKGKMVKINEFSNDRGDADDDSKLLATLISQPVALTQDADYIYALVTVAITDTSDAAIYVDPAAVTTEASVTAVPNAKDTDKTAIRHYIQKISKAQGDQVDDAYIPKTVESYELGNSGNKEFDCGDARDATDFVKAVLNKDDLREVTQSDAFYDSGDGVLKPKFTISNGQLTRIKANKDTIQAVKFKLGKDKVNYQSETSLPGDKEAGNKFDIDDKVDVYIVKDDGDSDEDLTFDSDTDAYGVYDVDANGNVWTVVDGKIYEFTDGSFTKVYTVDSSLDQINVYDEKNLIAWQKEGDIYTTVNEGTAETAADAAAIATAVTPAAATTATIGWTQLADGTWNFNDATGTKVVSNWVNVGGVWYYFKADGVMATNWVSDGSTWYYLNASGAMQTGWLNDNGTWYYLNSSGAMLSNVVVDGYTLNASGAWVK